MTRIVFESVSLQLPPVVVKVRVAVPEYPAGGVQVALRVLALGLKDPPALELHVPPVAAPATLPPRAAEVPPWHIAAIADPALAVDEHPGLNASKIDPKWELVFPESSESPSPVFPILFLITQAPPIAISALVVEPKSKSSFKPKFPGPGVLTFHPEKVLLPSIIPSITIPASAVVFDIEFAVKSSSSPVVKVPIASNGEIGSTPEKAIIAPIVLSESLSTLKVKFAAATSAAVATL
ncbi:hypothetical protein [Algoriphagus litoralis]|uniref:hypothetical protein n=1 Tax=Algoriphagus litoralis TaxID=2202829 RepID=UPI0018E52B88|nr:hypothetical protein [Algoriphagus litoralis]